MSQRHEPFLAVLLLASLTCPCLSETDGFSEPQKKHWAFLPVKRVRVPHLDSSTASSLNDPIDAFLAAQLQISDHVLSAPAERRTLIRRVTFNLIGLPPTPEEVADFLNDNSPDAYDRLVDRLLSSPHYGEAWGRNWLDVVRFAETAGFKEDPIRPTAYTYRDYVIRAFNRDLPFDRFVADQLAGDEMFPDDADSLAATGYCRMWPDESNASNISLARQTSLDDLTANVGAAFLGLSLGCAQCHDHKFDPLLQSDFYQLQAFFSGIVLEDNVPVGTHSQLAEYRRAEREWLEQTAALRSELNLLERPARYKMQGERRLKFPTEVLQALDTPLEDRTTMQRQLAFWSARQMGVKEDEIPKHLDDAARIRREEVLALLAAANQNRPRPIREASVMAVAELNSTPPATFRMEGGNYDKPRERVQPNFPAILRDPTMSDPPAIAPASERSSGRRSVLAKWLASESNPLTHRVWVNRLWQEHFGRGLVSNANDFGTKTPGPSHPELLDWLTSEFIRNGRSAKYLHRQIVLSATYRQRSNADDAEQPADAASFSTNASDVPYTHYPRRRLSSERIRDAWLMATGQLNDSMFGPGTRPALPPNFSSYDWKVSEPAQQVRRSVYLFAKRNLPYPLMTAFDFPDMHEACGCRTTTTIAPQALMLLNDRVILDAARSFAARARDESTSSDPAAWIGRAWEIAFSRPATANEIQTGLRFLSEQSRNVVVTGSTANADAKSQQNPETEAFADFCHALLNSNEFLFVE